MTRMRYSISIPGSILCLVMLLVGAQGAQADQADSPVVLLHGLARSHHSMDDMAEALTAAGFRPCNIDYPSTDHPIGKLASDYVVPQILECVGPESDSEVAFVTHSLGGIIVRYLNDGDAPFRFGRVVMLGPPNQGSEVVDKLGGLAPFQWINGPAGNQLGTGSDSVPQSLGSTDLDVGIIAGHDSINLILSTLIPGDDDGKVSIERAKLEGMQDFITVPVSHPFLMTDDEVIEQTVHFLQDGEFQHP
ncbi:esterase/lipase family protein [Marinobacter sp. LN3S78]|uniref:esterase/lipase family protein n=1 Tax=Marinobacter sp. LN3S78 TaxID=3382300 RepID=UPI00387B4A9A